MLMPTAEYRRCRLPRVLWMAATALCFAVGPVGAQAGHHAEGLERRVQEFVSAVDTLGPHALTSFFPSAGGVTYRRSVHTLDGTRVGVWYIPASDIPTALDGPLAESFDMNYESQPIGLFEHQVKLRRGPWQRVSSYRFVPPGGNATSPIYVDWRREGSTWVISEFGDEVYIDKRSLPAWCC